MKRIICFMLLSLLSICAACQDMTNLEDEAHVLSLGVDAGEERRYSFTVQIPSPTAANAEDGGFTLHSSEADSIYEAIDKINATLPWRLSFTHLNDIIFGGSLAAQGCLRELTRLLPSRLGFRTTCRIAVVKEQAYDFLEGMRGHGDINLAKRQRAWMLEPSESALFPECTYIELAQSLNNSIYTAIVPLGAYKPGDGASAMLGCALVSDGVLVDNFDERETLALMLARGEFQRGWYYDNDTAVELNIAGPREARVVSWEQLEISLEVYVKFDASSDKDSAETANIERSVAESLREELAALFERCRSLNADAFQLGKSAVKSFITNAQWEAYNWQDRLKEAQLNITVDCKKGA